jgi:hypothetical protein
MQDWSSFQHINSSNGICLQGAAVKLMTLQPVPHRVHPRLLLLLTVCASHVADCCCCCSLCTGLAGHELPPASGAHVSSHGCVGRQGPCHWQPKGHRLQHHTVRPMGLGCNGAWASCGLDGHRSAILPMGSGCYNAEMCHVSSVVCLHTLLPDMYDSQTTNLLHQLCTCRYNIGPEDATQDFAVSQGYQSIADKALVCFSVPASKVYASGTRRKLVQTDNQGEQRRGGATQT